MRVAVVAVVVVAVMAASRALTTWSGMGANRGSSSPPYKRHRLVNFLGGLGAEARDMVGGSLCLLRRKERRERVVYRTYKSELVAPVFKDSEFDLPNAILSIVYGAAVVPLLSSKESGYARLL